METGRKSKEQKERDGMRIRVATCRFISNMKSENDERVREAGKGRKMQTEGERWGWGWGEKTANKILFKTGCVRNHFPPCPSCVSFSPLITAIMEI